MTQAMTLQPENRTIPTAKSLPLLGAIPQLMREKMSYLSKSHQSLGDIYRINLGITDVIALNHPRHVQHVLRDQVRNYRKGGNMWTSVRSMFGNGLVVSEGEYWLRQRRMMQPHFHHRYIAGLFDLMLNAIDEELASWPAETETFDVSSAFNRITMQVIVRTMFGGNLERDAFNAVSDAMTYALDFMLMGMVSQSLPGWVPIPGKQRYRSALDTFDEIVFDLIKRSRANPEETHLLSMLLNTVDAETGEQMTDQQLRDEIATIFVAGYETTAIALAWAADFLAKDQHLQEDLIAEIYQKVGRTKPGMSDLRELSLTKQTFQEALRIRPSAWFLPRLAVEDDEIDGIDIPAGSQVSLMIYNIHNHPEIWERPDQFDPSRFDKERSKGRHPFAYVPFGAGQRQCIGRDFAYMEGQLILIRLLQKYRLFSLGREVEPALSTTLRPIGGIKLQLERR